MPKSRLGGAIAPPLSTNRAVISVLAVGCAASSVVHVSVSVIVVAADWRSGVTATIAVSSASSDAGYSVGASNASWNGEVSGSVGALIPSVAVPEFCSAALAVAVGWPMQNVPTSSVAGAVYAAVTTVPSIGIRSMSPAVSAITTCVASRRRWSDRV